MKSVPPTPLIALTDIRRRYGEGEAAVEVLRGVSLEICAGEFVAIVGASGSGKSTLMNLLGCIDRPTSGSYRFAGRDVAALDADHLAWLRREAFGFVFQAYNLIATETARENVEVPAIYAGVPKDQRQAQAAALLDRLGLGDRLDYRPNQLSGGQQQRVSIARALMNGGRIILADEPTGALDTKSGAEVMSLLDELADAGHTIILITHDRHVAERARRVIEISDGRIVADSGRGEAVKTGRATLPDLAVADTGHASLSANLREATRAAWRVMRINRLRTALTLLGIVIGVASVIVMMAVGEGARRQVMAQMGALGATILYLENRSAPDGSPPRGIDDGDLAEIARLRSVSRVMPTIGDPVTIRYGNRDARVYSQGITTDMPSIHKWPVAQGRFFTEREMRELAPVVVLGSKIYEQFFLDGGNPVGRQLLIGNTLFEIIGVMSSKGASSGSDGEDKRVFVPYRSALVRIYQRPVPDYVVVEAKSTDLVDDAEREIRALLAARHGQEDFSIDNAGARLNAEIASRRSMTLMLGLIAVVSLVVGGIGVMNVMLMTVKERTREIGIRMATGARQRDILRQFLTEAVMVSLVGGVAGVALGLTLGGVLLLFAVPIGFSPLAGLGAFGCAVATGLLFGFMPARSAARLDPVRALAGE